MRWAKAFLMAMALGLGVGAAVLAAGAGADSASTPAVELHLDTLVTTGVSPDGTTPAGTTPDSSGNGLTASFSGTSKSDGRFGGALNISYDDNGVTVPDNPLLRPAGGVTVMAWVRAGFTPPANHLVLGKAYANGCDTPSYGLVTGANGGLQFDVTTNGPATHTTSELAASALWDGDWHAVAGTYDGNTMDLWEDGVLKETTTTGNQPLAYDTSNPSITGLYAGVASASNGCDPTGTSFGGDIDEVRVYDRALTSSEIATLQDSGASTPPELPPTSTTSSSSSSSSSSTSTMSTTPTTSSTSTTSTTPTTSSTSTTSTTSSTTTTTTTSPPAAPPVASFTAPKTVATFHPILLNASGTTGATKLLWDVDGDGHTDFIRTPSQPAISLNLIAPTTLHVTLTAVGATGLTSIATHTVTVTGPKPSTAVLNKIRPVATAVSASPSFFVAASQAASGASCGSNPQTLTFGLAETIGCFDHLTDLNKVPLLERQVVINHYDSPSAPGAVSEICQQAREGLLPKSLCTASADLYPQADSNVYVSHQTVKLNGISITPVGPASVVVYPSVQRVISSFAIVKWGSFPVDVGPIDWDLHNQTPSGTANSQHDPTAHPFPPSGHAGLLSFDLKNIPNIAGFQPTGQVGLSLETVNGQYSSAGAVNLSLPSEFSVFGGKAPTAAVSLTLNNTQSDPVLDHLDLRVPEADFGAVSLTNVEFHYERNGGIDSDFDSGVNGTGCDSDEWKATADVFLLGDDADTDPSNDGNTALLMAPQPKTNGLVFCNGHFKRAGAVLQFGGSVPPPEVFPGVFVDSLNFYFQLGPTVIKAGAQLSLGEVIRISGTVLAIFATQGKPYLLDADTAGPDLQGLAGHKFSSTALAVGASVALHVPGVGDLNIAHGDAIYVYPSYFAFGISETESLGIFTYTGNLSFQMDVNRGLFEGDASANLCIAGFKLGCIGGLLVVSEKGAVACVNFHTRVFGHKIELNPGIGVTTHGHVDVWFPDGCKPSHYWSAVRGEFSSARAAGAAQPPISFTVAKGETSKSLKVGGQGGAPRVLVQGPGGQSLSVTGDGATANGALEAISASKYATTWLGVKDGRPGRYTITPLPGSVAITSFAETRPGYDTNFAAQVTRQGSQFVLHYDARKRGGGQKVTFFEDGHDVMHPLVTSTGGTGTVRFTPAPGSAGTRTIVARATVDDSPIQSQTLAHFRFAGTPRTGRPGRVRIRRSRGRLTVRWTAGAGASHYGVVLRLANGSMRTFKLSTRRSLTITGVPLDQGGTVQVSTQGVFNDWSKPRAASFKRLQAPFTVLLTNKHNERSKKKQKKASGHVAQSV